MKIASELIGSIILVCLFLGGLVQCYGAYQEYLKLKSRKKDKRL